MALPLAFANQGGPILQRRFVLGAGGLEKVGYRNNPLEKIAYDAQELFDRSTDVFDAEKFVSDRLAAL